MLWRGNGEIVERWQRNNGGETVGTLSGFLSGVCRRVII